MRLRTIEYLERDIITANLGLGFNATLKKEGTSWHWVITQGNTYRKVGAASKKKEAKRQLEEAWQEELMKQFRTIPCKYCKGDGLISKDNIQIKRRITWGLFKLTEKAVQSEVFDPEDSDFLTGINYCPFCSRRLR